MRTTRQIATISALTLYAACFLSAMEPGDDPITIRSSAITAGGGSSSGGDFSATSSSGQPVAGAMTGGDFSMSGGIVAVVSSGSCAAFGDCADQNGDGIRDDNCTWWACVSGACAGQDITFADMGGAFGACVPDGTADGSDRFHALNCFSNLSTAGAPPYPCEPLPPSALNVDAGGSFGACAPDGVCDGNDAFHALNAFTGTTACSCGGPSPSPDLTIEPQIVTAARLRLVARRAAMRPGEQVEVGVYLDSPLEDLRGYQLHAAAAGGSRGGLEVVDLYIEKRWDHVFAGLGHWEAFNLATRQLLAGLDSPGVATTAGQDYLATLVLRASDDAAGTFAVDLLHDAEDPAPRTFLFPTPADGRIVIEATTSAFVQVRRTRRRG